MRLFILFLLACLGVWYFWAGPGSAPDAPPEPVPVEDTFIGGQVEALNKAEGFEDQYLKSTEEHQKRMEKQLEGGGG